MQNQAPTAQVVHQTSVTPKSGGVVVNADKWVLVSDEVLYDIRFSTLTLATQKLPELTHFVSASVSVFPFVHPIPVNVEWRYEQLCRRPPVDLPPL